MKNIEIKSLVANGLSNLDYKAMNPQAGLKVYRICKELDRAVAAIQDTINDLAKKTLGERFDSYVKYQEWFFRNEALRKDGKEEVAAPEGLITPEEYAAMTAEYTPLTNEFLNAEAEMNLKPLTYAEFCELGKLNADKVLIRMLNGREVRMFSPEADKILDGVIWKEEE